MRFFLFCVYGAFAFSLAIKFEVTVHVLYFIICFFVSRQKKAPRDDDTALSSSKTVGTVGGAVKRDLLSTPFLLNKRAFDATERAFVKLETKRRSSKRFFFDAHR